MSYCHLFSFFLFYFLLYVLQFIKSLLKFRWYFISISIVCLSINLDSWDAAIIYGIFIVTETLSLNLSCVFPLTQILEMLLLYGIIIVTDRLQPSHLSIFFLPINFQLFSLYKLISMVFNAIVSWVFFYSFGHGSSSSTKPQLNECKRQIMTLELADEIEVDERWTLVA